MGSNSDKKSNIWSQLPWSLSNWRLKSGSSSPFDTYINGGKFNPLFQNSQQKISANHDKGLGFYPIGEFLYILVNVFLV